MDRTDAQLAREAIAGDAVAFGRLVERLRAPVIGYIAGLVRVRDEAEELAQDTFLRAWERLDSLADPACVGAWVYRIAHNMAMSRSRKPRHVPLAEDPPQAADEGDGRIVELLAALARLGDDQRQIIARKHFSGQSGHEIATQLGIAEGTVRSRLSRAYAELRQLLADED